MCNLEALEIQSENVILEITENTFNEQPRMLYYEMCQECCGDTAFNTLCEVIL
jgi:hypothetical protein